MLAPCEKSVRITVIHKSGRRARIRIDAPNDTAMERFNAVKEIELRIGATSTLATDNVAERQELHKWHKPTSQQATRKR